METNMINFKIQHLFFLINQISNPDVSGSTAKPQLWNISSLIISSLPLVIIVSFVYMTGDIIRKKLWGALWYSLGMLCWYFLFRFIPWRYEILQAGYLLLFVWPVIYLFHRKRLILKNKIDGENKNENR
jgi:hypothetical protein